MRFTVSSRNLFLGVSTAAMLGAAAPALADDHGKKMTTAELNKMSLARCGFRNNDRNFGKYRPAGMDRAL